MWSLSTLLAICAALGAACAVAGWVGLQIGEYRRWKAENREIEWLQWRNGDLESLAERMIEERETGRSAHKIASTR